MALERIPPDQVAVGDVLLGIAGPFVVEQIEQHPEAELPAIVFVSRYDHHHMSVLLTDLVTRLGTAGG